MYISRPETNSDRGEDVPRSLVAGRSAKPLIGRYLQRLSIEVR